MLGWSLGSTVAQELALRHRGKVGSLVLYGTWGRRDGFATALMMAMKHPWETGDLSCGLVSLGVCYSPDRIPKATFKLMTGCGSSHGLLFERTDDFVRTGLGFLAKHPLP